MSTLINSHPAYVVRSFIFSVITITTILLIYADYPNRISYIAGLFCAFTIMAVSWALHVVRVRSALWPIIFLATLLLLGIVGVHFRVIEGHLAFWMISSIIGSLIFFVTLLFQIALSKHLEN